MAVLDVNMLGKEEPMQTSLYMFGVCAKVFKQEKQWNAHTEAV
jgi:hypothetical protein